MTTLNVLDQGITINAQVNDITIEVNIGVGITANALFVAKDQKFYFDGDEGDTYFAYDSDTSKFQLYVNGNQVGEWG